MHFTSFPVVFFCIYQPTSLIYKSIYKTKLVYLLIPQHFPLLPLIVQLVSTLHQIKSPLRTWDISSSCSFNWRIRSSTCWFSCDSISTTKVPLVLHTHTPTNDSSYISTDISYTYNYFPLLSYFSTFASIHSILFYHHHISFIFYFLETFHLLKQYLMHFYELNCSLTT